MLIYDTLLKHVQKSINGSRIIDSEWFSSKPSWVLCHKDQATFLVWVYKGTCFYRGRYDPTNESSSPINGTIYAANLGDPNIIPLMESTIKGYLKWNASRHDL